MSLLWFCRPAAHGSTYPLRRSAVRLAGAYRHRLGIEALEERVTPAGSVTNLVSNPAQPTFGQPVTFTATVTPTQGVTPVPTGSVKYFLDGVQVGPIGGVTLDPNGQAGVAVPADFTYTQFQGGDHTIMADYLGDATYDVSGATLNETVLRAITSTSA